MKLTILLLTAAFLNVHASGVAQTVTISGRDLSLKQVFSAIEKQTGYVVFYNREMLSKTKPISLTVYDMPLRDLLDAVLKDQHLEYLINGKNVILSEKSSVVASSAPPSPRMLTGNPPPITGRVRDANGNPIEGVNVVVKGTKKGTVTDKNGVFNIDANQNDVLLFSSIGYSTKEIKNSSGNLIVVLDAASSVLDEVQHIAYGKTSKRFSTGDVSTIKSDEIERQPVPNPLLALQGNVPGMYVSQTNGLPGAAVNISIRGQNSIGAGNKPLYIIDGVPFNADPINEQSGGSYSLGANGETSPFNSINPTDIESISVLKDADATAIYGSRAANGVVLIITKKGKASNTKLNLNGYAGLGNVVSKMKLLNTQDYLNLRRQAFADDNVVPDQTNAPDLVSWGETNKDFQKILMGNQSHVDELSASISGGENSTTFFVSGTYHKEGSVYPGDKGYKRGSTLINLNHTSANKRFNAAVSVSISKDENDLSPQDITSLVLALPPNYPLYNSDGSPYWDGNFQNPIATLSNPYQSKTNNIITHIALGYQILPGLVLKTNAGYNRMDNNQQLAYLQSNSGPSAYGTVSVLSSSYTEGYILEPQLDYNKTLGASKLQAILGGTYQETEAKTPLIAGLTGFSSDALAFNLASAGSVIWLENSAAQYKYASGFGRVTYQLMSRYILNVTGRRDGSSRFGPDKKFGDFGSIGAAWIFSEEDFIKKALPWLSFGKLRSSYGTTGNDQIGNYGYLSTYQSNHFAYGTIPAMYPARIANPNYSWESTKKIEIAMDMGVLKDRILISAAVFRNRTGNMLVNDPLSPQTGFSSYQANLPALVQNTGIELELNSTNIHTEDFNWKTSFNLTIPRNKLVSFPGIQNSTYANTYVVGQPLSIINLYHISAIKDGIVQIQDVSHDGQISAGIAANGLGDYVKAGQLAPKLFGGFSNDIKYKNWQLDIFLQFISQQGYSNRYNSTSPPGSLSNQDANILKLGLKPTATFGSDAYNSYILYTNSDGVVSNASFVRLKNVSLSYSLPANWRKRLKLDVCNFYVRGQNLLTYTNYQGLDPETPSQYGAVVPPLRLYTIGIQCSL